MGKFLNQLIVKKVSHNARDPIYELTEPLIYESTTLVGVVIVPRGFKTDFGSIPRLPIVYRLFGGIGDAESCLHDYLYSKPHSVDRSVADKILRGAIYNGLLEDCDDAQLWNGIMAWVTAYCFWAGVRLFGGSRWEQ